jgi:hypothetical protein
MKETYVSAVHVLSMLFILVSNTIIISCRNIAEISLKVALNTLTPILTHILLFNKNTTDFIIKAGTAYPVEETEFILGI